VRVNEVKVDRSFVAGSPTPTNDRALVRATVQLAHSLGAGRRRGRRGRGARGVLRELGCDYGQGYHLGRPMPADACGPARHAAGGGAVRREPEPRRLRSVVVLPG
jgi:EAL domain-containing protein (putative c-di-GMP-specific phosphodiesterase class I)